MVEGGVRSLHVAQTFGLYDAEGRTSHIAPLVRRLADREHEVSVVAAAYPPHSPPGTAVVGDGDGSFPVTYIRSGFRYRTMTVNPGARTLFEERIGGVDLVHVHGLYDLLGPSVAAICRQRGVPYVVETMGMFRPVAGGSVQKRLFMRLFGRVMMRGAARFVATSGREADDLVDGGILGSRVVVRHNGVEPAAVADGHGREFRAAHGIGPEIPFVLFLGRISPVKNIELLLAAFARLSARDAVLVIAGPAEGSRYLGLLREITRSSQLGDRVRFVGPVYGDAKAAALAQATMLVLPSLNENFGTVALEAMAVGTPAVVTETCGFAEHLRDGGGLVVGLDAEDMRAAIDSLLANEEMRTELSDRARATASGLTWEAAAKLTTEMYEQVLS